MEHLLITITYLSKPDSLARMFRRLVEVWDTEEVKKFNMFANMSGIPEADPLNGETVWYPYEDNAWMSLNRVDLRDAH